MLDLLKNQIKSKPYLHLLFMYLKNILIKVQSLWVSDKKFIENNYQLFNKKKLNLKNPQTFGEKLQWLKLYYQKDLMRQCSDKYEVRGYIKSVLGEELLNTLHASYENVDEICFDSLPSKFVMKVTHGSGQNLIVEDKSKINWKYESKILKFYMQFNHYFEGREWAYKGIKPRIICEAYLDENGKSPKDYKFFCFNGEPEFIAYDLDRFSEHRRNIYDIHWSLLPFELKYPAYDGEVKRPEKLDEMVAYARKLAQEFPFVRVDFYCVNNRIYFGELTFYPSQGLVKFNPKQYDLKYGRLLTLPEKGEC